MSSSNATTSTTSEDVLMTDSSFSNTLAAMMELVIPTAPAIGNLFSDATTDDSVVIDALRIEYKAMQTNRASCRKVIMV
ncbi:hypothetical protein BGZ76_005992, partial [Entomortierella beljakovae]